MNQALKHRGYVGSVHYSDEDGVYFGRLEGIRDLVTYEGNDAGSLAHAFREAVDDYLTLCGEQRRAPSQPIVGK